jgi:hypothetical protein
MCCKMKLFVIYYDDYHVLIVTVHVIHHHHIIYCKESYKEQEQYKKHVWDTV